MLDACIKSLPDDCRLGVVTVSDRVGLVDLTAPLPHIQFVDLGLGGGGRRGGGGGAGQAAGGGNWSEPAVSFSWRRAPRCLVLLGSGRNWQQLWARLLVLLGTVVTLLSVRAGFFARGLVNAAAVGLDSSFACGVPCGIEHAKSGAVYFRVGVPGENDTDSSSTVDSGSFNGSAFSRRSVSHDSQVLESPTQCSWYIVFSAREGMGAVSGSPRPGFPLLSRAPPARLRFEPYRISPSGLSVRLCASLRVPWLCRR